MCIILYTKTLIWAAPKNTVILSIIITSLAQEPASQLIPPPLSLPPPLPLPSPATSSSPPSPPPSLPPSLPPPPPSQDPVAHQWTAPMSFHRRKWCNVCRKKIHAKGVICEGNIIVRVVFKCEKNQYVEF